MKIRKYVDLVLTADSGFIAEDFFPEGPINDGSLNYILTANWGVTEPMEILQRYTDVEFIVQRMAGSQPFDVLVQGLDMYSMTDELYGAPSVLASAGPEDWAPIVRGDRLNSDSPATLGEIPAGFGFYRAAIASLGDVTVRFQVVGIRR